MFKIQITEQTEHGSTDTLEIRNTALWAETEYGICMGYDEDGVRLFTVPCNGSVEIWALGD